MNIQKQQLPSASAYVENRKEEILSLLQEFVELPSCSREPEVIDRKSTRLNSSHL